MLVVIDPQRAFVDPKSSLARVFGLDDIAPSVAALSRLCAFLAGPRAALRVVCVGSEFRPGQSADGRLDHALSDLCVPGRNIDCEWAEGFDPSLADAIVTKHDARTSARRGCRGGE